MTGTRPVARRPEQIAALAATRLAAGDVDGLVALFELDALLLAPSGPAAHGPEQLRAACRRGSTRPDHLAVPPTTLHVSGDLALLIATRHTREHTATATTVARRQPDGRWLTVIHHTAIERKPS